MGRSKTNPVDNPAIRARDLSSSRVVALQVLRGSAAIHPRLFAGFRREAEVGMRIVHPTVPGLGAGDYGPVAARIYSSLTITRRLAALPWLVSLVATGSASPYPLAVRRPGARPL